MQRSSYVMATCVSYALLLMQCTNLEGLSGAGDADAAIEATTLDSAQDAAPATDAPERFCEKNSGHTFCSDFDLSNGMLGWTKNDKFSGGELAIDGQNVRSAPNALVATVPALLTDEGAGRLVLDVPRRVDEARIELEINPCAVTTNEGAAFFVSVIQTDGKADGILSFGLNQDGAVVQLYNVPGADGGRIITDVPAGLALQASVWTRVMLEITWRPVGHIRVLADGVAVVDETMAMPTPAAPTRMELRVGAYTYHAPACTARIDNVLLDAKP